MEVFRSSLGAYTKPLPSAVNRPQKSALVHTQKYANYLFLMSILNCVTILSATHKSSHTVSFIGLFAPPATPRLVGELQ